MPSFLPPGVGARIARLAETVRDLRERVREAVAAELSRVVADAVRDVLAAVLRRQPVEPAEPVRHDPARRHPVHDPDPWADEAAGWDDDPPPVGAPGAIDPAGVVPSSPPPRLWPTVAAVAFAVAKWFVRRRLPSWSVTGGVARSAVTAALGAADLVRLAAPPAAATEP